MKKFISISLAVTTILWLVGTVYVPVAKAAVVDGSIVSPDATFVDADGNTYYPYDVFIIKIVGAKTFKRLVLNPQVFDSYGHLKWSNIQKISAATVKGYTTSSLTRSIDDTKVYKLVPNGDMGTKQWVEDLACFTSKAYDWDSVYIINSTDRDNYTTGASVCGTVSGGPVSLSLASDNPAAATLPNNVQGVSFLKLSLTGTGTLNQITVKRDGAGAVDDFGDIFVYKNGDRLTSGRSLSSATSKVTFINLGIQAPATFEIVADISSGQAGDVNFFVIESSSDVTADGTVGGTFPIKGNPMGISGTAAGTLTVARSGASSRNITIGAMETEISQFKVTTATEGSDIKRIELFNGGTADNVLITNLKLKDQSGNTVATANSIGSDGYVSFVFATPFNIKKGESQIFRVYADIGATKPDRTIILYLELATDILGVGTIYGYGMPATITSFDATGDGVTATCKGGDLTLNKIGPNATNIGTTTADTVFLEYSMSAAADITIKRTRIFFCIDAAGDGTFDATSGSADMEDIKIKDKNSGAILAGPKDGTAINDGSVDDGCGSALAGEYEDFTDTIDISAGQTETLQLTADIKTSNTNGGTVVASAAKLKGVLYSYATLVGSTGNVNYMKYAGTTDAVDDGAIVPSGHISGETMTVAAAGLALTLAANPSGSDANGNEKVYVKGQTGVDSVGIIFTAGSASDITINTVQLTAYILEATGGTWGTGKDTNYVKDSIGNVYIYEKESGALIPGSAAKGFTSGTNYENVDFTGLSWTIPAGESKTLLVKSDISSAAPASGSGSADTWIGFDIVTAASDVTAIDKDGNSVDATGDSANGATTPTTNFGIADYGTLAIDNASDTPDKSIMVMGTADNEASRFKLTATNEAWFIEVFSVVLDDGGGIDAEDRDNFSAVKVKYQTQAQFGTSNWTMTSGKTFGANASLAFTFGTGDSRLYVPKDDSTYATALVSIAAYNGGNGGKSKVPFKLYDIDGSTTSFKAYGAQSGKQLIAYTTDNAAAGDFNIHFVARSKPVFAKEAWSGGELELARFTITAVGYDVLFDGGRDVAETGDIASAALRFDIIASSGQGSDGTSESGTFTLYDWNEAAVASKTVNYGPAFDDASTETSASFVFEEKDITIPSGTTKTFHLDIAGSDLPDFNNTDEYIYLKLTNDAAAFGDLATGDMSKPDRSVVWHDGTNEEGISGQGDPELRFGMPEDVLNIGSLPLVFRTLRGTTQ